ncbi:hypothetical protein PRNP1_011371 [Phytophthora ramorum]
MDAIRRRLNSLEVYPSWFFVRLLLLTGFSWAVHAAEFELFVFTRRPMSKSIGMTTFAVEAMGGGVFIGAAVGGPLFGRLADARGRRWALLVAKSLSLVGLVLSSMARRDYEIISARILAGIGLGGELPVATVLVHELVPKAMRGRVVSLLEAFSGVGGVVGVVLVFGLVPQFGWRIAYLAICGGILYVGLLCFLVPESPRWLASVGRTIEAVAVMEKLERAHGTRLVYDRAMMQEAPIDVAEEPEEFMETGKLPTFEPARAASMWTLWVTMALSSYALGVYVPVLISLNGFNVLSRWSTMALLGVAQVFGAALASLVLEDHGLKKTLTCFTTSAVVVAVILSYASWNGPVVVVGTCTVSALLAGVWSCLLVYAPKTFSPEIRGRGVGYAFGSSQLAAVAGSWLHPQMFNVWLMSVSAITWTFGGLMVAAVFGAVLYGHNSSHHDSDLLAKWNPTNRWLKLERTGRKTSHSL